MSKINVLPSEVYNKISAGEVVEKPASVVKEFIENSLDAKASEIIIEIENGGIDRIKVIDNGEGINPSDVKTAFLPHATSKIQVADDLFSINTLGFRGEALPSIASVSKVKLQTKQKQYEMGKLIEIEGGIVKRFEDTVINDGTIVEIRDLFYNIPARRKFLRKPKSEESEITNLVLRYILANPFVKFTYYCNNELVYKTEGSGLEDAIYLVYKKDTLNNLLKVEYKNEEIEINGYISKPSFTKSNRTYQTLIINNRYVINSLISTCVQNAYENILMKGQFPMYVLNVKIPSNKIDVNVHPTKLDVKFDNTQKIYGYFYSAISKTLLNYDEISSVNDSVLKDFVLEEKNKKFNTIGKSFVETTDFEKLPKNLEEQELKPIILPSNQSKEEENIYKHYSSLSSGEKFCESPILSKILEKRIIETNQGFQETTNNATTEEKITTKNEIFSNIETLNYKIIGVCFDTYIMLEMNDSLFVLDQHACHERLNYDKFVKAIKEKNVVLQPLLVPYILEVNSLERDFIEDKISLLSELGFEICEFGNNCFKISSIPSILFQINLSDFFKDLLGDLSSLKKFETTDILKEKISQKACKSSIKAGDKLKNEDIEILLEKMKENNMTLACPHGRPCIIEINKNELEKWFKRKL